VSAKASVKHLGAPQREDPRHLTLDAQTSFTLCCPSDYAGGWTEVRTATVTIRKLGR
jgi:hypothetical protein